MDSFASNIGTSLDALMAEWDDDLGQSFSDKIKNLQQESFKFRL